VSTERVPVDDPEVLRHILANAEALLLDFDGPVCSVFAGFPAHVVAHQLRGVLADGGHEELPAEIEKAEDPFDVLRYAAVLGSDEVRFVEAAMRSHEVEAIVTAEPTQGAHQLIRSWRASGRKLAIVSNNSVAAIETYLNLHGLKPQVNVISARTDPDPMLLKPSPHLIDHAASMLETSPVKCLLIGDSLTDLRAARAAGTLSIGYANKPGKAELFASERPSAITMEIESLIGLIGGS
jgi:phosphoglycolate phosphatase